MCHQQIKSKQSKGKQHDFTKEQLIFTPASPRFQSSWNKVVELSTSHSGGPASLSMFSELCTHLDRFVTIFDPDCPKKHQQPSATLHRMWTSLGQKFIGAVKEVSQPNCSHQQVVYVYCSVARVEKVIVGFSPLVVHDNQANVHMSTEYNGCTK